MNSIDEIGFIILRHVNSETTNRYWKESYTCVRKFYPNDKIIIIDDSSDPNFLTNELTLYNTEVINSVFQKGKGELLPIYYYLTHKWFKKAIIIHDSVFFNNYIDFSSVDKYKFLWHIVHDWNDTNKEVKLINSLNNNDELLEFYNNNHLWNGCFGCMLVINHDYLKLINDKYNLFKLFSVVNNRSDRSALERVLGCILILNDTKLKINNYHGNVVSLLGSITDSYYESLPPMFGCWEYNYEDYIIHKPILGIVFHNRLPILKVWTGR